MGFRALSCNVVRIKIESRREKERGREQQPYFFFFFLLYNFLGSSHALGKLLFLLMVPKKHVVGDLFFFFSLSLSISNTHTHFYFGVFMLLLKESKHAIKHVIQSIITIQTKFSIPIDHPLHLLPIPITFLAMPTHPAALMLSTTPFYSSSSRC